MSLIELAATILGNGFNISGDTFKERRTKMRTICNGIKPSPNAKDTRIAELEAQNKRLRDVVVIPRDIFKEIEDALKAIREHTDADNPESYRCDDREGCLDTVHAKAKSTLAILEKHGEQNGTT